jgi:hypothetical protein
MPVRAAWWWYRSSECKGAGSGVGVVWAGPRAQRPCLGGAGRSQSVAHLPGVQRAWVDRNIRGCRRNRRDGGVVIRAEHAKRVSMAVSRVPAPAQRVGGLGWLGGRGATRLGPKVPPLQGAPPRRPGERPRGCVVRMLAGRGAAWRGARARPRAPSARSLRPSPLPPSLGAAHLCSDWPAPPSRSVQGWVGRTVTIGIVWEFALRLIAFGEAAAACCALQIAG